MTYMVWCEVWGGVTGSRQAPMKDEHGNVRHFDKEEAEKEAKKRNEETKNNPRASFRYTVRPI